MRARRKTVGGANVSSIAVVTPAAAAPLGEKIRPILGKIISGVDRLRRPAPPSRHGRDGGAGGNYTTLREARVKI